MDILIAESEGFPAQAISTLSHYGQVTLCDLDRNGLLSAVRDADVLWVRLRHLVDEEVLASAPKLRFVATPTTGLNHIDLRAALRRNIQIVSLKGEAEFLKTIRATAELTLALVLMFMRRISAASQHAVHGRWNRDIFKGSEVYGKTIGVVGYGRLGRIVSRYFTALGANVIVADPYVDKGHLELGVQMTTLPLLLTRSDIVSLHVSLDEKTFGFFDKCCFDTMKRGALFINTARGELVDEEALLDALNTRRLSGACVDVLCGELRTDFPSNPLLRYASQNRNLIITPHIGGCTLESSIRTEEFLATKLAKTLHEFLESKGGGTL